MKPKKIRLPYYLKQPGSFLSATWLAILILFSATGKFWMPWDAETQSVNSLMLPSASHWLGTDDLGRDIFSRLFASGGYTLYASMFVVLVALFLGVPAALLAAERGNRTENILTRISEIMFSIPMTIMLLTLVGIIGRAYEPIMMFMGILIAPGLYRVLLGQTKSVRQRLYVDAARLNGLSSLRVNLRHVLPALYRGLAVQVAIVFAVSIMMQAGLAFIGIGPADPTPSWGAMIQLAQQHIYDSPWLMVPPGLALILTVMAANQLADSIGAGEFEKPKNILIRSVRRNIENRNQISDSTLQPGGAILSVRNLVVRVKDKFDLVSNISFEVDSGRVLGIVGESGCGKTMTGLSVLGLLPQGVEVEEGQIFFDGEDIATWSDKQYQAIRGKGMAFISQEPMVALDPMFTVASQLTSPIRRLRKVSRAESRKIALDLLRKVGLPAPERVMKSYPHQLSGGMAQRVAIALALTGKPKLLIADEPTTALDVTIQAEILELLRGLVADMDMALIIVTHNLGVVADIADEVAVMYAGQIVESGKVAEVLTNPQHPYTAALLGADPHVPTNIPRPERLASIRGSVPQPANWTGSCRFVDRCGFASEACRVSLSIKSAHTAGTVACVRSAELKLEIAK